MLIQEFCRDQGRIQTFIQEGATTPSRGRVPNILIKFPGKPYKIKEILVRGWGAPEAPPLDTPLETMEFSAVAYKFIKSG